MWYIQTELARVVYFYLGSINRHIPCVVSDVARHRRKGSERWMPLRSFREVRRLGNRAKLTPPSRTWKGRS